MAEIIDWPNIGMTVDECAKALRVDRKSIFSAIQENRLPARKVGKGWRIDPDAVKAWLATGNATQTEDADNE